MKSKIRQNLFSLVKLLVAVGLIYWLIQKGYLESKNLLKLLEPFYLSVGLLLVGANILTTGVRWAVLTKEKGFDLPLSKILPLHLIGVFFNFALPAGSVGGDLVKGYYVVKDHPERKLDAGLTVLMDRVIGFYAMLAMSLLSILWNYQLVKANASLMALSTLVFFAFGGATVVIFVSLSKRAFHWSDRVLKNIPLAGTLLKLYQAIHSYHAHRMGLLKAFSLSFLSQSILILFFIVMGHALGESQISFGAYFFSVPIGLVTTAIPISQGGVGVGQVAMLKLFEISTGTSSDVGQTAMTLLQILMFAWGLCGAYFYIRYKRQMTRANSMNEVTP